MIFHRLFFMKNPSGKCFARRKCSVGMGAATKNVLKKKIMQGMHSGANIENLIRTQYGYTGEFYYLEHHLSHAASSFYPSGFDSAAILTIDGVGEKATTTMGVGKKGKISILKELQYPHSVGLLYSAITSFLGFKVNNDEYKVMGLASYGKPEYQEAFGKLVAVSESGAIILDLSYFEFHRNGNQMFSDKMAGLFGPPRVPEMDNIELRHANIAASLQLVTEKIIDKMLANLFDMTGEENLCMAGGVALNSVANWKCFKRSLFKHIFIQPAAGDGGSSIGAALWIAHQVSNETLNGTTPYHTMLGPAFCDDEIQGYLDNEQADYTYLDGSDLYDTVTDLILENKIIGWFQGRMEFGPRALGNRSILANPCHPAMKDIINRRVKFREDFRPFAPAVIEEEYHKYFDLEFPSPYMLFVPKVRDGMAQKIPAVTHVDNSARVQTVSKAVNPKFHSLIKAFGKKSGIPVLINTSFNIRGEPIVCSPKDAYKCFLYTDIDYLVMGNFLIRKEI
ncbi:MAG: carbamoyltransferase [Desulfobacula sp.]|nr:carbamoyltransferase [Desulfobacula sp.]